MKLLALVLVLSVGLSAQEAKAPTAAQVQATIAALKKVVANQQAVVLASKPYQDLVDAQAALKLAEALLPVEPKPAAK